MKRFLIPIVIFAAISWGVFFVLLKFTSPFLPTTNHQPPTTNHRQVVFFLSSLSSASLFTLALILYFFYRFIGDYVDERQTMRRALRQSSFVSLGLLTLAILQLTKTLNPLTLILTAAVTIALEFTFRATR